MYFGSLAILLLVTLFEFACCRRQFCGPDLANVMKLVCDGRGYNIAFRTEIHSSEKRYKRGIVDECCKRGCTWSTLETYCSPAPENINIRKRSDSPTKWLSDQIETENKYKYDTNDMKSEENDNRKLKISFSPAISNRNVPLRDQNTRPSQLQRGHSIVGKVKRNDVSEDLGQPSKRASLIFRLNLQDGKNEIGTDGGERVGGSPPRVPIRHRHRKADTARKSSKDNVSSQIGTVPPYFLGRTLVLPPSSRKG